MQEIISISKFQLENGLSNVRNMIGNGWRVVCMSPVGTDFTIIVLQK